MNPIETIGKSSKSGKSGNGRGRGGRTSRNDRNCGARGPRGDGEEYLVEKILERRIIDEKVEYFIKWDGYSSDENTWEPEANLPSRSIEEFEESRARRPENNVENQNNMDGLVGLEPEKILGASDNSGQLMFLMKWKNADRTDLIAAAQANVKYPQTVIKFYEDRLVWSQRS